MNHKTVRVLHVFRKMDRGGAEALIINLYQKIDRTKYQFDFVVHDSDKGYYDDLIKTLGGQIYYVPSYNVLNHLSYKKSWNLLLDKVQPNILHAHLRGSASIFIKIAKKKNIPTIMHSHSISSRGNIFKRKVKELLQLPLKWLPDYYFACSESSAQWLFGKAVTSKDNYFYIPNAIDTDAYKYDEAMRNTIREQLNINKKDIVLGHVGNFMHAKNHEFLVILLEKLPDNYKLIFIGEGNLESLIRELVIKFGLEKRVLFLGAIDNVNEVLNAFDYFLFPSLYEGLGMAAVEAQANGLKSLLSFGVPKEAIILDETVQLPLELSAWKEIISFNKNDRVLSATAQVQQSGYDINQLASKVENIYDKILKGDNNE